MHPCQRCARSKSPDTGCARAWLLLLQLGLARSNKVTLVTSKVFRRNHNKSNGMCREDKPKQTQRLSSCTSMSACCVDFKYANLCPSAQHEKLGSRSLPKGCQLKGQWLRVSNVPHLGRQPWKMFDLPTTDLHVGQIKMFLVCGWASPDWKFPFNLWNPHIYTKGVGTYCWQLIWTHLAKVIVRLHPFVAHISHGNIKRVLNNRWSPSWCQ